jgi:hypothetical protein
MDIKELQNYRLSDAVKFHKTLNPKLWGSDEHLLPEVREKLMAIAADFKEFLGLDLEVKDITISGSNAAYTYSDHSDIDLHLVADLPRADRNDVYRELFDAKKYQYNDQHNFKIGGYDVELYVQNANQDPVSQGIYSVANNEWISVPKRRKPDVDDISVRSKYEDLGQRIDAAIESGSLEQLDAVASKLRSFRQAGLDSTGEFGPENLAFKVLRSNGTLDRLRTARLAAKDQALSITERKKKRAKKKTRYGQFGGVFFPGFHYYDQSSSDAGGDGGGGESVQENADDLNTTIKKFAKYCSQELGIENMPRIRLKKDPEWSQRNATFGRYIPEENTLILSVAGRHPMDIMRTLAHELIHRRQDEIEPMPDHAGETGSEWENEANARAGVLMRGYGEQNPDTFEKQALAESKSADLYHGTTLDNAVDILDSDTLFRGDSSHSDEGAVSFTRNFGEAWNFASWTDPLGVIFVLDQARLSQALGRKLKPFDYGGGSDEQEEASEIDIPNVSKYIKQIIVLWRNEDVDVEDYSIVFNNPKTIVADQDKFNHKTTGRQFMMKMAASKQSSKINKSAALKATKQSNQRNAQQPSQNPTPEMPAMYNQFSNPDLVRPSNTNEQVVAEASGYIPVTDAEARDPRYSMAVTVDIRPGEPRRQAAKLGWKTTAAGTPPTARTNGLVESLTRRLQAIKEEQDLEEVAMSPSSLRAFANSPAAEGMQAGFEAELIFTGLGDGEELEPEWEADYDYDPRPDNIEEIIDFFQSGDFGDLSGRREREVRDRMINEYSEWLDEKMMEDWAVDQDGAIRDMIADEEPDLSDEELEDRVNTALGDQNSDYESALDAYREDWGGNYDEGDWLRDAGITHMSEAANEYDLSWPHYVDLNSGMGSEGGFNEENAERLADDLAEALGVKTTVSSGYHSAKRDATTWIFEPDSSLDPSNSDDMPVEIVSPPMPLTQALEILPKFFAWAESNGAYANKTTGFHMSVSMGDHENNVLDYTKLALFLGDEYVLKQFGREANTYAKSAISKIREKKGSVNAEEILSTMRKHLHQFASRALAQPSGFGKYTSINPKTNYIEFRSAGGSDYFADMEKIQNTLMRYARATDIAMDPAADTQEYAKKLYKLLTDVKTQQTVDPKTGSKRTEVVPSADNDAISIFSRYVAGQLPKSELRNSLKQLQQGRNAKRQADAGKSMVWQVTAGSQIIKVVATSEQAAKLEASREWNIDPNSERFSSFRAVPIGPAPTQTPATDQLNAPVPDDPRGNFVLRRREGNEGVGPILYRFSAGTTGDAIVAARRWAEARGIERRSVYLDSIESLSPEELRAAPETRAAGLPSQTDAENRMAIGDQTADANFEIVDNRTEQSVFKFIANTIVEAARRYKQWLEIAGLPAGTTDYGLRRLATRPPVETEPQNFPAARPPAGNDGHWEIRDSSTNQVLHTFSGIGTRWEDANQVAAQWLQQNGSGYSGTLLVHVTG